MSTSATADEYASSVISGNVNMMVPWYLMSAFAYYVEDDPIVTDEFFDNLSKTIKDKWDAIDHVHKACISFDDLDAGTFLGSYPPIIPGAVKSVRAKLAAKIPNTVPTPPPEVKPVQTGLRGLFKVK